MANFREILKKKLIPVTFERTLGLFGATTIGVGALMGAGVYVLIGMAADAAGPAVWISYTITGALAFLTTLLYAELARMVPMSGGGYAYSYSILGSVGGFATGWFLALGSIFACGLYAVGFAEYFMTLLGYEGSRWGVVVAALVLVLLSTLINSIGTGGDRIQNILTWGNLLILLSLIVISAFKAKTTYLTPMFPKGFSGMAGAISIIYISFFGYQLIANNSDEIKNPRKTVPRAMILSMLISFSIYLAIAVIAVMVVPWQELGASNAPLVVMASKTLGPWGWIVISIGGVLAAAGALNSTLLSQGRQIYAMGKNRFLPDSIGKINEKRRTPQAALITGGGLVILVLVFLDLEFIAKAANFCLLASLLPVSLALRKIYRTEKEHRPKFFLKRILPEITLIANITLLFTLDWLSLTFGFQLAIIGAVIYWFYSRKREKRSQAGLNVILQEDTKKLFLNRGSRILMPVSNPKTQEAIFAISNAMLDKTGGEVVVLSVVNAPKQTDFYAALSEAEQSVELIENSAEMAKMSDVPIIPLIRASRNLAKGIVHAAQEENANLIVMGYGGKSSPNSTSLMEEVLHHANTDIIFLKIHNLGQSFKPKNIAVSLGGNTNLPLMVDLAGALAQRFGGRITFLNILPEEHTKKQRTHTDNVIVEAIHRHRTLALYNVEILTCEHPQEMLVERSKEFDLLVIGTTKVGIMQKAVLGTFATQLADKAHCPVAIVRVVSSAKKLIGRI